MIKNIVLIFILVVLPGIASAQTVSPPSSLAKYRSALPPLALTYRSGYIANPSGAKLVFSKLPAGMSVGSIEASADDFECAQLAIVTLYDCGASHACASPKTVASVMVSSANSLFQNPVKASIGMGDYYAWSVSGKCTGIDVTVTARAATPAAK